MSTLVETSMPYVEMLPKPAGPAQQPKFRFKDGTAMLAALMQREKELLYQRDQDKMVFDAFDRMPPIDPADLKADGEEWRTNADFGDTEAAITERVEAVNNQLTQPCPHIIFNTKKDTPPDALDRLERFSFSLYKWLRRHPVYIEEVQQIAYHMVSTGVGWVNFGMPGSWYFDTVPRSNVIYPKNAKKNIRKLPWVGFRIDQSVNSLIEKLADREASTAVGWNTKAIEDVLQNLLSSQPNNGNPTIDSAPDKWTEGLMATAYTISAQLGETVQAYRMYVREYDNVISESIVMRITTTTSANPNGVVVYQRRTDYKGFEEFMVPFWLSIGSTYIEKVRGFGHRILPERAVENDLLCRGIDATILSGSLMLKARSPDDADQAQRDLRLGHLVTIIPEDIDLDQKSFSNPAAGMLALEQSIRQRRAANSRVWGGPDAAQQASPNNATAARLQYMESGKNAGFESDRLELACDMFHKILWNRLKAIWTDDSIPPVAGKEEALDFWKNEAQQESEIQKSDLAYVINVSSNTALGNGDPSQLFFALQDLSAYLPSAPLTAQKQALRMMFAARTRNPELAYQWFPVGSMQADRELNLQMWRVSMEDGLFETSDQPVPVQDDDNHPIHAEAHTKFALNVLTDWNNHVLQPDEAFKKLFRCQQHTSVHLTRMKMNKAAQGTLANLNKQWQGIENMMRRMQQMVQEAQQAQQQKQLEELRNPQPSVKEREHMITAQLQRQNMMEEHKAKMDMITQEAAAKAEAARNSALTAAMQESIKQTPTINADEGNMPIPPPVKR